MMAQPKRGEAFQRRQFLEPGRSHLGAIQVEVFEFLESGEMFQPRACNVGHTHIKCRQVGQPRQFLESLVGILPNSQAKPGEVF